ncbi:hypothetical protein NE237_031308 [Protea cynaroides]|uniref:non-specific serine/threonine protein kinase n=1 Tax=Protea cynaroides TaxID=273540 RepID=A0A9Q0L1A4_9MAGN|nr:hypothetical protein NE237_031308 [Protea cynaroides]
MPNHGGTRLIAAISVHLVLSWGLFLRPPLASQALQLSGILAGNLALESPLTQRVSTAPTSTWPLSVIALTTMTLHAHITTLKMGSEQHWKEAGGVSFRAVQKVIQAQVSQNFLEIHLFWAGKGTYYIPTQGTHGPSISAISAIPMRALNSIFRQWGIKASAKWNISGEPCSGIAIDSTSFNSFNPAIKCDCSYNNDTACHITKLKATGLEIVGIIPDELMNLTYLSNLYEYIYSSLFLA